MNNSLVAAIVVVLVISAGVAAYSFAAANVKGVTNTVVSTQLSTTTNTVISATTVTMSGSTSAPTTGPRVQIVAGENFWGSLVSQLGGARVQVVSIVSDPNTDPHEYESNAANARAIANASFVIVNGAGYDDWALKILAASSHPNQKVLNVADLVGKKEGDNPHFWYSPYYVNATVHAMYSTLISVDPANAGYYKYRYAALNASLASTYMHRIALIKQQFAGTKVAATENVFEYLANATALNLVSPPEFMKAVAEGNDPPAQSVVQFQNLIKSGNVSVLVYNMQTVTPLTQSIKALAAQNNVTITAVTETIQPPDVTFQDWMNAECISLQNALNQRALGK